MGTTVVDNPQERRYEIFADGELAGFAAYERTGEQVVLTHTEIGAPFEGRGLGSELVHQALDRLREQGASIVAVCPFVRQWIARHPDYQDLEDRNRPPRGAEAD